RLDPFAEGDLSGVGVAAAAGSPAPGQEAFPLIEGDVLNGWAVPLRDEAADFGFFVVRGVERFGFGGERFAGGVGGDGTPLGSDAWGIAVAAAVVEAAFFCVGHGKVGRGPVCRVRARCSFRCFPFPAAGPWSAGEADPQSDERVKPDSQEAESFVGLCGWGLAAGRVGGGWF